MGDFPNPLIVIEEGSPLEMAVWLEGWKADSQTRIAHNESFEFGEGLPSSLDRRSSSITRPNSRIAANPQSEKPWFSQF